MSELECFPVGIKTDGVCLELKLGPYYFLLDCGLKNLAPLMALREKHSWSGVFCSHAHADHCRSISQLQEMMPDLPIFATAATTHLLSLACPTTALAKINSVACGESLEIAPNLSIKLLSSGHLPGAASIWLSYVDQGRSYNVLYTGDFLISNSRLVQGLKLEQFRDLSLDVLILEGTCGTARHPHRRTQEHNLVQQINRALALGYAILFPVPKIGIGQEILMLLRSHHAFTGRDLDIWIDDGVGAGCDLYLELLTDLPASVQNFAQHQSLFWDDRICPRIQPLEFMETSEFLSNSAAPRIVLVDQDTDWQNYAWLKNHPYLIFLPESKPELAEIKPEFAGKKIGKKIDFVTYLLSEHCDGAGTTQLIHNLKPQHLVFMHGKPNYLADLANLDELSNRYHVHCPQIGKPLELPIGEDLHFGYAQNQLPPYAGELFEQNSVVNLTLPAEITLDSRWQSFADTGLIEAKWQGDELLIRGISPRELLNALPEKPMLDSCQSCRFFSGSQHCLNQDSPLVGLKVSFDGYCLGFEKISPE